MPFSTMSTEGAAGKTKREPKNIFSTGPCLIIALNFPTESERNISQKQGEITGSKEKVRTG